MAPDAVGILGSWPADFPEAEELRKNSGTDVPRESL
jgi:hypothetical protein